jgi:conjugative relaxase-like TrwC/TraI family protein
VISVKQLHGPDAWRYLMESVTDGQGDRRETSAITRYYTEAGTPPGRWFGSGLAGLAAGAGLVAGSVVSGEQMDLLFGQGRDPVTGAKLGRAFRHPPSYADRVAARMRALPHRLSGEERQLAVDKIRAEERARKVRRPVVGFDYVFNPPKSVSALWAVADQRTREQITAAHHDAVTDVLHLIERDVARTRIGTDGVAQVKVRGVVAAAFDHYDSRANDPQLHTHLVVANRAQAEDGRWRTLDSRGGVFPSAVALSETYDNLIADHLTRRLGVAWEVRDPGRKAKNARWEIAGVPDELIDAFSQRHHEIVTTKDELISEYRERTGREPDDATILRLRQRATLATRAAKKHYPLAVLAAHWRHRAAEVLGINDPGQLVATVTQQQAPDRGLHADDFAGSHAEMLVDEILARVHESRSTWTRWNIHAEAARASMRYRLATTADRDALHQQLIDTVQERSVMLSAPPPAITPPEFQRADGTSQFTPEHSAVYTSGQVLDAEARLLDAGRTRGAPRVEADLVERVLTATASDGQPPGEDQAAAVHAIATSGRGVDVLVGPAGSGKTTTLDALRAVWETEHGTGSVIGLAPTAKAAHVLSQSLGVTTENTAKWLAEHARNPDRRARLRQLTDQAATARAAANRHRADAVAATAAELRAQIRRWELTPGQLLIVDEASMCGTLALDTLTTHARAVGAKVLLAGDWAQLSAVESGGAFRMLVHDRTDVPELSAVRRFTNDWERAASVQLRVGDNRAIDAYTSHNRVHGGAAVDMMDIAYTAWAADEHDGHSSLLIADTNAAVADLNTRARADRIVWGLVEPDGHRLHDSTRAGTGDRIVTRQIDRTLSTGPRSWVKNGDQWIVVQRFDDGSLAVRRTGDTTNRTALRLPAAYVAAHVELAYATTAHRAQGDTVDTAHALVRPEMSREVLYVAMTRARQSNTAYVCTDTGMCDEYGPDQDQPTAREVLEQVLAHTGAELSAHETIHAEHERVGSIAQLAAEYDTIAREHQRQRWAALAELGPDEAIRAPVTEPTRIAGLFPAAEHVSDPQTRQALDERAALIEQRAEALVAQARTTGDPWLARLGPPPADPTQRLLWDQAATTVAAYRDRHGITDPRDPVGEPSNTGQWTRRGDRRRAQAAAVQARRLASQTARQRTMTQPDRSGGRAVAPDL